MKNIKKQLIRTLKNIQAFTPVLIVGLLIAAGAVIYDFGVRAAGGGFYFTAVADSYKVGDSFEVGVYENSGTECANVAQADFSYPSGLLRFDGFSSNGSKFESSAPSDTDAGKISIVQFTTRKECGTGTTAASGISGRQLIGTASFTVLGTGSALLNFLETSTAISSDDNKTNVAPDSVDKSFRLTAGTTPAATGQPATGAGPKTAEVRMAERPVTSVIPQGSDTAIELVNNDTIEISGPVKVGPLPVQPDGIDRIEYYLSGTLVATAKTPPYTYKLDPARYLNSAYTLTTKTFYENGQIRSVSQRIEVNNPFGWSQVGLWLRRYVWAIALIILAAGVITAILIVRRRHHQPDSYYGNGPLDNAGDYPEVSIEAPEPQIYRPDGKTKL